MTASADVNLPAQGMYFLANDRVLNWSIAMLESFRAHEPDMPLMMIPFDERIDELASLRERYRFTILRDLPLKDLDALGRRFYPTGEVQPRLFRKLAVFFGPFERFLFADVDLVFLDGVGELLSAYPRSGFDLLHADEDLVEVYFGEQLRRRMVERYNARGFNTGFWASRRGLFSMDQLQHLADRSMPDEPDFNHGTGEQAFLNYCCDVTGVRYANFATVVPDLSPTLMAEQRAIHPNADGKHCVNGKRLVALHWAGRPANDLMPYRKLFLHYRLRPEPVWRRLPLQLRGLAGAVVGDTIRAAGASGTFSRLYKRLVPTTLQNKLTAKLRAK